ncbi:hypothetical protein ABVT39_022194 [Epinephelus coioides]
MNDKNFRDNPSIAAQLNSEQCSATQPINATIISPLKRMDADKALLWATAGALSCRKRGAFSDFPISPSRVHCAASTSRPTANRDDDDDDDMRPACFNPAVFPTGPRCPKST